MNLAKVSGGHIILMKQSEKGRWVTLSGEGRKVRIEPPKRKNEKQEAPQLKYTYVSNLLLPGSAVKRLESLGINATPSSSIDYPTTLLTDCPIPKEYLSKWRLKQLKNTEK